MKPLELMTPGGRSDTVAPSVAPRSTDQVETTRKVVRRLWTGVGAWSGVELGDGRVFLRLAGTHELRMDQPGGGNPVGYENVLIRHSIEGALSGRRDHPGRHVDIDDYKVKARLRVDVPVVGIDEVGLVSAGPGGDLIVGPSAPASEVTVYVRLSSTAPQAIAITIAYSVVLVGRVCGR